MHKLLLPLLAVLSALSALPALAQDFEYTHEGQTLTYTILDPEAKTVATKAGYFNSWDSGPYRRSPGNSVSGNLIIPATVFFEDEPYTVTKIGDYGFCSYDSNLDFGYSKLTSVSIPNSVTEIGNGAFADCSSLTEVHISDFGAWCEINFKSGDSNPLYYAQHLFLNGEEVKGDLVIPNSVTSIGSYTFYRYSGLTSVSIPNSVTSIGSYAFYGCTGLTSVSIGNSVTEIGYEAFYGCTGLTSVSIGNSVTEIGYEAFYGCSGLTSVTIPNSVTSIGYGAFAYCSGLTEVHISDFGAWCEINFRRLDSNPLYYAQHLFLNGEEVKGDLVIPNSVTSIGSYAFYSFSGLTSVTIPNSVTSIGYSAFRDCSGLTSVSIGNSVTEIDSRAFSGCSRLTSVSIPNSVTSIGNYAFSDCSYLTSVSIPNSVTSIGDYAFSDCSYLTSVSIPNSVTSIGSCAFYGCTGLTSVSIGNSVTEIGYEAFYGCSLKKCAYPNTISNPFPDIEGNIVIKYPAEGAMIDNGIVYGPQQQVIYFMPLNSPENITIPASVTSIGESAFALCDNIKQIVALPFKAPTVAAGNFTDEQYKSVEVIVSDADSYAQYIADPVWAKFYHYITSDGNKKLAFRYDDSEFSYVCFETTKEACLVVDDYAEKTFASIPNRIVVENEDGSDPQFYTVTAIGEGAFAGCKNLTGIKFPKDLKKISPNAFSGCSGLSTLDIPATVKEIGAYAFSYCSGLKSVDLPALTEINDGLFQGCTELESVTLPENLERIGIWAFAGCFALTSVNLPATLTEIGERAFYNSGLTEVTIPNSVTSIGIEAFTYCSGLTEVTIPNSVTSIGSNTFEGCSGLTSVIIGDSVTSIGNSAFSGCSRLTSVSIPNSVTSIGSGAFWGCFRLTSISIPNSVTSIGLNAFTYCSGLTEVTIPASVEEIGEGAFRNCSNLTSAVFADSHVLLENPFAVFGGSGYKGSPIKHLHLGRPWVLLPDVENPPLEALETLSLGNTVTEIPDEAFANLPNLTSVTLSGALESIGERAFAGCNLQEVVIPPSVTYIGAEAFSANSDLTEIKIGHGIEEIGERAFADCNKIANIYVTATTPPSAQNNTFSNYSSPLWLPDEETFDLYYNYPRCWYRFEDNMFTMKPVETLSTANNELTGVPGESIKVNVSVEPADATLPQIFWSSSDPSVATVDSEGNVTFTHEPSNGIATLNDEPKPIVKTCTIRAHSMNANVPMLEITLNKTLGEEIVSISVPEAPDSNAPTEVYTLQGIKVSDSTDNLPRGIYIIRQGNKSKKVAI